MFVNPEEIEAKMQELVYSDKIKVDIGKGVEITITDDRLYPSDYCHEFTGSICMFPGMILNSFIDNYCKYLAHTLNGIDISKYFTDKGLKMIASNACKKYRNEHNPIDKLCGGYIFGYDSCKKEA